jgi:hypothetical protein
MMLLGGSTISVPRLLLFQGKKSGIAALVTDIADWKNPSF